MSPSRERGVSALASRGTPNVWRRVWGWFARLSRAERIFIGLVILCYTYFLQPGGTNTFSRYDMVSALSNGSAIIDGYAANTIDVSVYHGHFYSPRSIGLSLLATPVLRALRALHLVAGARVTEPRTVGMTIAVLNLCTVVPAAIAAVIIFERFILRLRPELRGTSAPIVAAGAFGLCTLFFPMSTEFYSHAFAGALAFAGFYLLYRAKSAARAGWLVAVAGALVGFAIISEYPVGVIMLALAAYTWVSFPARSRRMLLIFAAGMLPGALALGWYNWFAFGNPLHLSYEFVAGRQFAGQHTGLFGITYPRLGAYWQLLVYPRGLLVESPFLIFLPVGFYRWFRSRRRPPAEALVCLAVAVLYPTMIAGYYLPMAGENLPGPRLLVPALPFACLALAWVVDDVRRGVRAVFAALLAAGALLSFLYVAAGVREDHTRLTYPLTGLYWPILSTGVVPRLDSPTPPTLTTALFHAPTLVSVYFALIPLLAGLAWAIWALVRGVDAGRPAPVATRTRLVGVEPVANTVV